MKMMKCNEVGGACNKEFYGETFEEIARQSKEHAMEMINLGDKDHINAMDKMGELMKDSKNLDKWMGERKEMFDSRKLELIQIK